MMYNSPCNYPHGTWGRYGTTGATHRALDFRCPTGTPIRCAGPGRVTVAGWSRTGFGWHVRVKLDDGNTVIYAHLQKGSFRVKVGERVQRNQILALSDNSGNSTGPHCHMEVRKYSYVPLSSINYTSKLCSYQKGPLNGKGL